MLPGGTARLLGPYLALDLATPIDPIARLEESDPEAWSTIVDVNLKGVYYGMRYAVPAMAGAGTIINISMADRKSTV